MELPLRLGGFMACTSGCPTPGAHANWGECLKAKGMRIAYAASASGQDKSAQDRFDRDLDFYASARSEGIQPMGTKRHQVEHAFRESDKSGEAYDAGTLGAGL